MDEDTTQQAMAQLQLEIEAWLADEAAQVEFRSWLDLLNERNGDKDGTDRNETSIEFRDDPRRRASRPLLQGH